MIAANPRDRGRFARLRFRPQPAAVANDTCACLAIDDQVAAGSVQHLISRFVRRDFPFDRRGHGRFGYAGMAMWRWRVALLSLGALGAVGCTSSKPVQPGPVSGGNGPTDGGGATSGTSATGGIGSGGTDAGQDSGGRVGDCPAGLAGPTLVNVPAPADALVPSYCVDATEVTNTHYAEFLAALHPTSGQDAWCTWNTSYTPSGEWPATGKGDYPVVNVNWCDAYAYCKWAGKHLCGKIGGGPNDYEDFANPARSEWFNACSAGGSRGWPYGDEFSATACYGTGREARISSVASKPTCEGAYFGLYDLSGNAWEWEDSCNFVTGSSDYCRLRGWVGSSDDTTRCGNAIDTARNHDGGDMLGFRCCAASL